MKDMKFGVKGNVVIVLCKGDINLVNVKSIIVVCDVGMGFSVMGVSMLCKKVKDVGFVIYVLNLVINSLLENVEIVIIYKDLIDCVCIYVVSVYYILLSNFLDSEMYN